MSEDMLSTPTRLPNASGLVLAGGRSERFGGQDKGLMELHGVSLIERVIRRLAPQVREVYVSANRNLDAYRSLGYPVLEDRMTGFNGPLAGILRGLETMDSEWLICCPCDAPFFPDNLAAGLLQHARNASARICYVMAGEQSHYVHVVIHHSLVADLRETIAQGRVAVGRWYQSLPKGWVTSLEWDDEAFAFENINHPEDLRRAQARFEPPKNL